MSGARSRRKGHNHERAMVHEFAEVFGTDHVRRGLQAQGGCTCADVITPALWPECKVGARTNPRAALAQAIDDSEGSGLIPLAVCRDDRQETVVMLRLSDFKQILAGWWKSRNDGKATGE